MDGEYGPLTLTLVMNNSIVLAAIAHVVGLTCWFAMCGLGGELACGSMQTSHSYCTEHSRIQLWSAPDMHWTTSRHAVYIAISWPQPC